MYCIFILWYDLFLTLSYLVRIIAKTSVQGHNFLEAMQTEIPITCIPAKIGGQLMSYNESFEFDLSETGPLSYVGCPLKHIDDPTRASAFTITTAKVGESSKVTDQVTETTHLSIETSRSQSTTTHTPLKASSTGSVDLLSPSPLTQSPSINTPKAPFVYRPFRWSESEEESLRKMRTALADEIASFPPFPDLVGDRKLIRFLRGRSGNVTEAIAMYGDFLKWYKDNGMIEIRHKILYENINNPYKFPYGRTIIELGPQIVIAPTLLNKKGHPLVVETFDFNPADVFKSITIEQYLEFLKYCLEYRSLIFEQMSEELEMKYLVKNPDPATRQRGYGVIWCMCSIRDLKGLGLQHISSKAKQFLGSSLKLAIRK